MSKEKESKTPTIINRKANHLYSIEDRFEVGIMLIGSEVKSIRDGKCSLNEAWVDISEDKDELWLVGAHIDEYILPIVLIIFQHVGVNYSPTFLKFKKCAKPRNSKD